MHECTWIQTIETLAERRNHPPAPAFTSTSLQPFNSNIDILSQLDICVKRWNLVDFMISNLSLGSKSGLSSRQNTFLMSKVLTFTMIQFLIH